MAAGGGRDRTTPSTLDPSDASEHLFQGGRDLVVRAYDESRARILAGDGRRIAVSGGWAAPLVDGDGRGVRDGRVLLLAERELLAVRLPDAPG